MGFYNKNYLFGPKPKRIFSDQNHTWSPSPYISLHHFVLMFCYFYVTKYISGTQCSCCPIEGSWECALRFLVYSVYSPPAMASKPRDIKDDNLLGIPLHFLIETRGVMDSGVERSTGPVCWGPSVGSCSVYAPSQEWKASVSRAILFS